MDISGVITAINNNTPAVFIRFGDGEYYAAIQCTGRNCDGTPYTPRLGVAIRLAFSELLKNPIVTIGRWHQEVVTDYLISLAPYDCKIHWGLFNTFMFQSYEEFMLTYVNLYRTIRSASQQKIFICNEILIESSKLLLNIDNHIKIHPRNWFEEEFNKVYTEIKSTVKDPSNIIFLVSAGMGGKYLIYKLATDYPCSLIFDVGSALDQICGSRRTRNYHKLSSDTIRAIWETIIG